MGPRGVVAKPPARKVKTGRHVRICPCAADLQDCPAFTGRSKPSIRHRYGFELPRDTLRSKCKCGRQCPGMRSAVPDLRQALLALLVATTHIVEAVAKAGTCPAGRLSPI